MRIIIGTRTALRAFSRNEHFLNPVGCGQWDRKGGSLRHERFRSRNLHMEEVCVGLAHRWFALCVKAGHEKIVATIAHNKGFEEFLPLHQSHRRWSDRIKSIEIPLFPGYVFCRLDPERRLPLLTIPGVMHLVGIGKIPAPIGDAEIETIQMALREGLFAEPWPFLEIGQRVRLESGPLAGLEGLLLKVRDRHRIVVSVSLLRRSVAVEIERDWVEPLDKQLTADPERRISTSRTRRIVNVRSRYSGVEP